MLAVHITPKLVGGLLVGEIALLVALYLPSVLGLTQRFRLAEAVVMTVAGLLSFGIATVLCLEVASEYQKARWSQLAWQLLAVGTALSLIKRLVGSPLFDLVIVRYRGGPIRGLLDNSLFVPANLFLLAGLMAIWWSFHRIGLGFKIKPRDYAIMAAVAILFLLLLVQRQSLSQAQSPYQISRILQLVGLSLLGIISAFGLMLHRSAVQMGDGRLAAVMRWLTVYVVLRGLLVLLGAFLNPKVLIAPESAFPVNEWAFDVLWQIVPWTAAIAAACRAQVTVKAAEQLSRLRANRNDLAISADS